jgi:hypothetical protein
MSQLQTVLRRSVAHLDPSDLDGRERMFTNAREAMIRLLWSYDPPLTPTEIDSKIEEFDTVVSAILQEEPDSEAEPAISGAEESATSSLITPEPEADETLESEASDTAEPASFSAGIALPPREPIRKLARFQPLSQIGSPTPGKPDTNKTSDAIPSPAVPDANAAAIAALAAFDNMVGSERSAASAAGTVAARSAVHIGGETRSTPSAVYRDEDDSDTDAVDSDEGSSAEDALDDLLFHVRDDELPSGGMRTKAIVSKTRKPSRTIWTTTRRSIRTMKCRSMMTIRTRTAMRPTGCQPKMCFAVTASALSMTPPTSRWMPTTIAPTNRLTKIRPTWTRNRAGGWASACAS